MNDHPSGLSPGPAPAPPVEVRPPFHLRRSWKIALGVVAVMVLLALLGVGLTTTNRAFARTYWVSLVPVYGLLCVAVAWSRSRFGEGGRWLVLRQVVHWLGIAAALALD